ncbi:nlpC/P60 family protein [Clostridium sp. CAG:575]|nr:nlpC/P60 family protein [Clostridium sp. CAG:575]
MKNQEKASISIMKVICVSIILILISGIGVMAVNTNLKDVKIILKNGYELTALTSKSTVSEILDENNIILEDDEKTVPDLTETVKEGTVIKIVDKSYTEVQIVEVSQTGVETTLEQLMNSYAPITEKIVVEQVTIPFETITKNTAGTSTNTTNRVIQQGKDGLKEITYKIKYQNDIEIEKLQLSEKIITEPVNKIVQVNKNVTSRSATTTREKNSTTQVAYSGGKWTYSSSEMDLLCAITAQECGSSYTGSLAVITTACNRAESTKWKRNGSDPLSQYKAKGQFCYSIDSNWRRRLNGNYPSYVVQAVTDALNGKRNHSYLSFRAAGTHAGTYIGGNVYF